MPISAGQAAQDAQRRRQAHHDANDPGQALGRISDGLDPEGIAWIRKLMRRLAAEGRTVLMSSHLMSEMEYAADHLLVIGRGRLIAGCPMAEFIASGPAEAQAQGSALERANLALTADMIRTSLTVMPSRAVFYWSKLAVFTGVSSVISLVTGFGVFFLGKALLGPTHVAMSLSSPGRSGRC